MKRGWGFLAVVVLAMGLSSAVLAEEASVLLENAVYTEETVGDVDAAIGIYKEVIEAPDATRALLQQAHHRLALCYMKKGMRTEATAELRRLTAYPGDSPLKAEAHRLLAEFASPDPAALMPPETFLYLEFGSPGRQLSIVEDMLEGTPFEDPFAAVNQGMSTGVPPQSPVLAPLMNPGMVEEFKKIGGAALGVYDLEIREDFGMAHIVAAAYLGESEALRGIAQAAVLMAGRPMPALGGMQRVSFAGPQQMGLAYDDNVMIFATSLEQLDWCVRQYQGMAAEPTLATGNAVFARLDEEKRGGSAMTAWVDARQAALALQDVAATVPELAQAAAVAQMIAAQGVESAGLRFVLDEHSPFTELTIGMATGGDAPAYAAVRTGPLDHALLRAVPAEAIALSASAFSPAQMAGMGPVAAQVDLSFMEDLDQCVMFVLPFDEEAIGAGQPPTAVVGRLGLAMSVKEGVDPAALMEPIASIPQAAVAMAGAPVQPVRREGDTVIVPLPPGGPVSEVLLTAAGDFVVMSAGREALDASLDAIGGGPSALDRGPLHEALAHLEPETNKLVLGSAGPLLAGAMSMARATGNVDAELDRLLGELATVLEGTSVQVCTRETDSSMTMRLGVLDLPPAERALPVLMAISEYAEAMGPSMGRGVHEVAIERPQGSIAVDGNPEDWRGEPTIAWTDQRGDQPPLRLAWTAEGLYGLVTAYDGYIEVNDEEPWTNDGVQLFIETDHARRNTHSEFSRSLLFWPTPERGAGGADIQVEFHGGGETTRANGADPATGVKAMWKPIATGYTMEFFVPAEVLAPAVPQAGTRLGMMVFQRDGSATPTAWLSSGVGEDAWARPDKWALVRLAGKPVPVDVGYTETPITVDGETSDWTGVPSLAAPEGEPFQLRWDEDGLYGLVTSEDDHIRVNPSQHWTADGMQIFLEKDFARSHDHTANSIDIALWPDPAAGPGPCGMNVYSHAMGQIVWPDIATAWAPTADGYVMEFHLPADFLRPAVMLPGTEMGFTILLRAEGVEAVAVAPQEVGENSWQHPDEWGAIRLVEEAK